MTEMMQSTGVSRRKFMAWAGGAAGFCGHGRHGDIRRAGRMQRQHP